MSLFHPVYYLTDPFMGTRVTLGALARDEAGEWTFVAAPMQHRRCLGRAAPAIQIALQRLKSRPMPSHEIGAAISANLVLGPERHVPERVEVTSWLKSVLVEETREPRVTQPYERRAQRATVGYRFFERHGVEKYVRKRFRPVDFSESDEYAGLFPAPMAELQPISHYVWGPHELLLMEPIIPTRDRWNEEVHQVATLFTAYGRFTEDDEIVDASRVAYVMRGGPKRRREEIVDRLKEHADHVIDIAVLDERQRLVEDVRRVGRSAELQFPG